MSGFKQKETGRDTGHYLSETYIKYAVVHIMAAVVDKIEIDSRPVPDQQKEEEIDDVEEPDSSSTAKKKKKKKKKKKGVC